jgi:hypothetical protein
VLDPQRLHAELERGAGAMLAVPVGLVARHQIGNVADDQQLAGAIMKLGGAAYLWAISIFLFFKRFGAGHETENTYVRSQQIPTAEIVGNDDTTLTYEQVQAAFDQSPARSVESEQAPREQR